MLDSLLNMEKHTSNIVAVAANPSLGIYSYRSYLKTGMRKVKDWNKAVDER